MKGSSRRAWLVGLLVAAGVAMIALLLRAYGMETQGTTLFDGIAAAALVASLLAFLLSGGVILVRRPGNPIGVLLLIPGLAAPAAELATRWLGSIQPVPTELTPVLWLLVWWTGWAWLLLVFPIFQLLLVFPTGALLTPRWRLAVILELAMAAAMVVLVALDATMGPVVDNVAVWTLPNPVGFVPDSAWDTTFGAIWAVGLLLLTCLSAVSIVLRFRRGGADERQQLKWPVAGALVFVFVYLGAAIENFATGGTNVLESLLGFGLAAIPVSVAIAVLRYRLYEIDRIISRTIGWALVTGILVLTFVVLVVALQAMLQGVTQGGTLVVAVSTLVAASLFQPIRGRVQRAVDRRFDRARYDGELVVARFGERLREHVDLDTLSGEVRRVADDTVRPSATALWLRSATKAPAGPIS